MQVCPPGLDEDVAGPPTPAAQRPTEAPPSPRGLACSSHDAETAYPFKGIQVSFRNTEEMTFSEI